MPKWDPMWGRGQVCCGDTELLTKRIASPADAARIIQQGGLVAFPTETVFGLGVDATSELAVQKLFHAKGRPPNNPLIVHVSDVRDWTLAASQLTPHAEALLAAFAPGPITVVLPKHPAICSAVTAGLPTVGLRVPSHPVARSILRQAKLPVAAPSANRSGRPSGTTWQAVLEDLDGRVDAVYCSDVPSIGIESTVVDCCGHRPLVLRPGGISLEQLRQVVPEAEAFASTTSTLEEHAINSPGLLHPHYQPSGKVHLVDVPVAETILSFEEVAYCGLQSFDGIDRVPLYEVFSSVDEFAAEFYEFLRRADRRSLADIFVQLAPDEGIGGALRDRQRRAASR